MFSSKDEWKEGLSATQLDCIIALENEKQKLARERKDFQFQMESLQVELEKAKLNSEGTKREVQKFEREIEQANVKNDVLSKEVEKLNADLREKESLVLHLNQELNLTKAQRDKEKESKLGLEREIKSLTNTHVLDMDRLTDECCKFKERQEQETLERTSLKEELQAAVAKIAILNEDVSKITAERDLEKKERQILQTQVDENEKSFIEKFDKVYEENLQLREINDRAEERIKGLTAKVKQIEDENMNTVSLLEEEKTRHFSFEKQAESEKKRLKENFDEAMETLRQEKDMCNDLESENIELKKVALQMICSNCQRMLENPESDCDTPNRKKSERWNIEVFELRRKVEELEKRNREMNRNLERNRGSVEAIRLGFEGKICEEKKNLDRVLSKALLDSPIIQLNLSKSEHTQFDGPKSVTSLENIGTPDDMRIAIHSLSSDKLHLEDKVSCLKAQKDRLDGLLRRRDETISMIEKNMKKMQQEKDGVESKHLAKVRALEQELKSVKALLREREQKIVFLETKVQPLEEGNNGNLNCHEKARQRSRHTEGQYKPFAESKSFFQTQAKDSGVEVYTLSQSDLSKSSPSEKSLINQCEDCENEVKELEGIMREAKEAFAGLTEAFSCETQSATADGINEEKDETKSDVERKYVELGSTSDEIKESVRCSSPENENEAIPSAKQSYVISRFSASNVDVAGCLEKISNLLSYTENRLTQVCLQKEQLTKEMTRRVNSNDSQTKSTDKKEESKRTSARGKLTFHSSGTATFPNSANNESKIVSAGESQSSPDSCSAVIQIARIKDATIKDGTIDDIAHNDLQRHDHDREFNHSVKCKLLWQQLCDTKGTISSYEREILRLKNEIKSLRTTQDQTFMEYEGKLKQAESTQNALNEMEKVVKEEYKKQEGIIVGLEKELLEEKQKVSNVGSELDETKSELSAVKSVNKDLQIYQQKLNSDFQSKLDMVISYVENCPDHNKALSRDIMNFLQTDLLNKIEEIKMQERDDVEYFQQLQSITTSIQSVSNQMQSVSNQMHTVSNQTQSVSNQIQSVSSQTSVQCDHQPRRKRGKGTNSAIRIKEISSMSSFDIGKTSADICKNIEEQAYLTATQGYTTIDEIEGLKFKFTGIQDNIKMLVNSVNQVEREKGKLQEECKKLLENLEAKDGELSRTIQQLDIEKHKVDENDSIYRSEMEALKSEQIEIYKEFRDLCDNVKRKDIELLNKKKEMKQLHAEWKEKEEHFKSKLQSIEEENKEVWKENSSLRSELEKKKSEIVSHIRRMENSDEQLKYLYKNLTSIDNMFHNCKQRGLYP